MKYLILCVGCFLAMQAFAYDEKPYNRIYSPERDPFEDFQLAQLDASADSKLVLIVLGGDWCLWCHRLEAFLEKNRPIDKLLNDTFVVMKVNVSHENYNQAFIGILPESISYPFFVIADADGNVIGAQETFGMDTGDTYSRSAFARFINRWDRYDN